MPACVVESIVRLAASRPMCQRLAKTSGVKTERCSPYPIKSDSRAAEALMSFINDAGIPQTLVKYNANAETDGEWGKTVKVHHIQHQFVVPYSPWQNLEESSVRHPKQGIRRATLRRRYPKIIWYYCGQWVAAIRILTALDIAQLNGHSSTKSFWVIVCNKLLV